MKYLMLLVILLSIAVVAYETSSRFGGGSKNESTEHGENSLVPSVLDPARFSDTNARIKKYGQVADSEQKQLQPNAGLETIQLPPEKTPLRELYRDLKKASAEGDRPAASRLYEDTMSCVNYLSAKGSAETQLVITSGVPKGTTPFSDVAMDNYRRVMGKIDSVLESNEERCESVDYDFLNKIKYEVTLAAAKAGDEDAAACFVSAPFTPGPQGRFDGATIEDYRSHAVKFAADGLRNGDWRVVTWLGQSYGRVGESKETLLLYKLVPPDQVAFYAYTMLTRLGANEKSAHNLDEFLRGIRSMNNFSVSQINQAEGWANAMYQQYFSDGLKYDESQATCDYEAFH